jgi:hypothetical protein
MALGPVGKWLGWSSLLKAKIRGIAAQGLEDFLKDHPEYR